MCVCVCVCVCVCMHVHGCVVTTCKLSAHGIMNTFTLGVRIIPYMVVLFESFPRMLLDLQW